MSTIDSSKLIPAKKAPNSPLLLQQLAKFKQSLVELNDRSQDKTTLGERKTAVDGGDKVDSRAEDKKKKKEEKKRLGNAIVRVEKAQAVANSPATLTTLVEDGLLGNSRPSSQLGTSFGSSLGSSLGSSMGSSLDSSVGSSIESGIAMGSAPDFDNQVVEQAAQETASKFANASFGSSASEGIGLAVERPSQAMASPPDLDPPAYAENKFESPTFQVDESATQATTAVELESKVQEAVNEAAGSGHQAEVEMLKQAEVKLDEVQVETQAARRELAEKAPTFSRDLSTMMEQYSRSDSQSEQSIIKGWITDLLDGAPEGMAEQVSKIRTQVGTMFTQTESAWKSREDAQHLQLLQAAETGREREAQMRAGQGQKDSSFVKEQTSKELVRSQLDSKQNEKVQKALQDKGLA